MASISAVKIANFALSHIGNSNTIESFTEGSKEAQVTNLWYDIARQETLKAASWSFARKRVLLALHGDAAPDEWGFRYQEPSDSIMLRELVNPAGTRFDQVPYEKELSDNDTVSILTNLEDAKMLYTSDVETVSLFPPDFVTALSYFLASRIARSLTGKKSIADDMLARAIAFLRIASSSNFNEQAEDKPREAEWIRARGASTDPFERIDRPGVT